MFNPTDRKSAEEMVLAVSPLLALDSLVLLVATVAVTTVTRAGRPATAAGGAIWELLVARSVVLLVRVEGLEQMDSWLILSHSLSSTAAKRFTTSDEEGRRGMLR